MLCFTTETGKKFGLILPFQADKDITTYGIGIKKNSSNFKYKEKLQLLLHHLFNLLTLISQNSIQFVKFQTKCCFLSRMSKNANKNLKFNSLNVSKFEKDTLTKETDDP